MKKYLKIFCHIIVTYLAKELSFRCNFLMEIVGSFCFVGLYVLTIIFLMPHVRFGQWTIKEMWLLLGIFLIVCYSVFYFFWRGLLHLVENIRTGQLDFYLTKPIDSQFFVSVGGGGTHNLMAIVTGIVMTVWAVNNLGLNVNILQVVFVALAILLSVFDFYCLLFLSSLLNFRFGYLGEASFQILDFQTFSRYPMEAFKGLPIGILLLVIPFSALSTIPAKILIDYNFPIIEVMIFALASILLVILTRKLWFKAINSYTSAS